MTHFIRWALWSMAIYFVLVGQLILATFFLLLGLFPLITVIVVAVLVLSACTTYNTYDSFNTTEIRINDMKIQRSPINPNNPYKRGPNDR